MIVDSHTHTSRPGAVINLDPTQMGRRNPRLLNDRWYSVGIHPWNSLLATTADLDRLRELASRKRVVAIGECGLDTVHESYLRLDDKTGDVIQALPDLARQTELLKYQIALSEELRLPLLLHVVKRFPEILALKIKIKPRMPWVIHGFRGKPRLVEELMRHGFYISYGEHFNRLSVEATPSDRMLAETDDSSVSLEQVIDSLPVKPQLTLPELRDMYRV